MRHPVPGLPAAYVIETSQGRYVPRVSARSGLMRRDGTMASFDTLAEAQQALIDLVSAMQCP